MLSGKETNKIMEVGIDRYGQRHKHLSSLILVSILSIVYGFFIFLVGGLGDKWLLVSAAPACFLILVKAVGSVQKGLLALLIFSLSMRVDVKPWWSERYADLRPGMPITLTAVLLLALYMFWFFESRQRECSIRMFPWITLPFCLLVLWSGLSFLVAEQPSYVLNQVLCALTAFFLYFYVANSLRSEKDIYFVLKCVAVTIALSGLLGICQYVAGDSFNLQFMGGRETQIHISGNVGISRVSGFLEHSNIFAWLLGGLLPLLLTSGVSLSKFPLRSLYLISFTLGFIALVLTFSRGGWLGLIFSFILVAGFFAMKKGRQRFRGVLVRVLFLGLASMVIILPFSPQIIARLSKDDYGAAYSRIPMAQTALKIIRQNPITGIGLGNYSYVALNYDPDVIGYKDGYILPVHNIYLHVASELGIPALSLFMWLLVAFFSRGISALNRGGQIIRLLALGLVAGLAGLCLHGLFEPGNLGHPRFLVISFMGGLLVALAQSARPKKPTVLTDLTKGKQ